MASTKREDLDKKSSKYNEPILVETKVLNDFKCGNCGVPLLIHVYFSGDNFERVVECKGCGISFPLEGNNKSADANADPARKAVGVKKDTGDKKETMVERLVKTW
ncbi:MAG: hypothetical protein ACUVXA_03340 [Candidatus Jordarchaeum sp.]|uniref:hypothetical protein n=1 Tax=Candidatus Jordarchaeum sp. TaxID=2823881 RepID=UPI0040497950